MTARYTGLIEIDPSELRDAVKPLVDAHIDDESSDVRARSPSVTAVHYLCIPARMIG
jgi:hypothetical protein